MKKMWVLQKTSMLFSMKGDDHLDDLWLFETKADMKQFILHNEVVIGTYNLDGLDKERYTMRCMGVS